MAMRRAAVAWAAALVISCGLLALPLVALAATSAVSIQNSAFAPPTVTVRVGDTVTWTNRDAFSHTSTSDTGAWDSGVITAGSSHSFTFASAGTFAYHCAIHAFMHGTVVVQAVNTPTPQPTPPPTPPPTPVRTAPPTIAVTTPPTIAPTDVPTAAPTTVAPTATPSATAAVQTLVAATQSPVAVQLTPPPTSGGGLNPILIGAVALAVVALGAIAFFVARRSYSARARARQS
jgi:plastocyanin